MKQTVSVVLAVIMLASLVAMVPLGTVVAQEESDDETETSPGEQLSGAVGVQGAELDGELESRTFGIKVAQAETDEARADIVAEQLERNEQRFEEIDERYETLRQQRDAGEISQGTYRAQVAISVAETETVNRTTNQGAAAAADLSDDLREERGIDNEAIRTLQDRANELTGPEVAEIARGIAGDRVGGPIGPDDRPGPDRDRAGSTPENDD